MKKLKKRNTTCLNTVELYGCTCKCWCLFPWTLDENVTDVFNGAR